MHVRCGGSAFRGGEGEDSFPPMAILDRRAAWLLFGVLALTALVGFSQGLVRALGAPRPEAAAAGVDPVRDPVPNASPLTGPVLDEARIRQIAREEASAALGAGAAARRKAAAARTEEEDEDAAAPMSTAGAPAVPALPPPSPAPTTALPPTPTPPPF